MSYAKILDMIKCPECSGICFEKINFQDGDDIKNIGALICKQCNQLYIIQESILSLIKPEIADRDRELAFISNYSNLLPEISVQKRINTLQDNNRTKKDREWILSEKIFWDQKKYRKRLMKPKGYNWDRFEVRKRHIINYIKNQVQGKTVIEFGGGTSNTLYHIMNPRKFNYTLVCTDISYNALLSVKNIHPDAVLIQCDAIDPPFRDSVIDIIFDFGILHHLPNNQNVLENHTKLLKRQGYLGLHEPIDRRPAFFSSFHLFKKFSGVQSEHNEFINEKSTLDYLNQYGKIIHKHLEYSPVRNWMVKLFTNIMKINKRWMHYLIISLDQLVIKTIGRMWNRMDGSALILIWKKI